MSEAIAFDTHKFVKNLTESGFTEQQAEALAKEQGDLLDGNLATKTDIEALRQATKSDIAMVQRDIEVLRQTTKTDIEALRQATKSDIAMVRRDIEALKSELLKWTFGALIAQGGVIVALVKLL